MDETTTQLQLIEDEARGYDPYNNTPPRIADQLRKRNQILRTVLASPEFHRLTLSMFLRRQAG